MTSCCLWEEKPQGAKIESTIRSILNAAMTCHPANGGRTFRNTAWDRMTGCPTRFGAVPHSGQSACCPFESCRRPPYHLSRIQFHFHRKKLWDSEKLLYSIKKAPPSCTSTRTVRRNRP